MTESNIPASIRILLTGFCLGLFGEGVLFVHRQLSLVERSLSGDFRVLVVSKEGRTPGRIEDRLSALPGVAAVRFVPGREALSRVEEGDPELAGMLARGVILPDSYEVVVRSDVLAGLAGWVEEAAAAEPRLEFHYEPGQAAAILQVRFYERFLMLAALVAAAVWAAASLMAGGTGSPSAARGAIGMGTLGSLLGIGAGLAMAFPLKAVSPLWGWPHWWGQALLLSAGGLHGWSRHDRG